MCLLKTGACLIQVNLTYLPISGNEYMLVFDTGCLLTVKTLNIGTPRPATVVVLNIKQFNFTMK